MATAEAHALQPPDGTGQLRHEFRAIYAIWLRDIVRFKSERTRIVSAFAQPLIYLVVMGTGLGATVRLAAAPPGFSYLAFMYPGILGMTVLFAALFSAISIIWDREFGFLREILVAPISRTSIVIGKVLGGATVAAFQGTVLLMLAPLVGVPLGATQIVELSLVMFLAASALTSLGLAIASRMTSMEGFQVVMNFLVIPMWLLSGAFFPLRGLPGWMTVLARVDPLTYAVDGLRGIVFGQAPPAAALVAHSPVLDAAVIVGFLAVMLGLALWAFRSRED